MTGTDADVTNPPATVGAVTDGAVASGETVNEAAADASPAPFVAVTWLGSAGSVGAPACVYVAALPAKERLHPTAGAGNA